MAGTSQANMRLPRIRLQPGTRSQGHNLGNKTLRRRSPPNHLTPLRHRASYVALQRHLSPLRRRRGFHIALLSLARQVTRREAAALGGW